MKVFEFENKMLEIEPSIKFKYTSYSVGWSVPETNWIGLVTTMVSKTDEIMDSAAFRNIQKLKDFKLREEVKNGNS